MQEFGAKILPAAYREYYKTVFGDLSTKHYPEDDPPEMSNKNEGYKADSSLI